jgi:hypothetical protein
MSYGHQGYSQATRVRETSVALAVGGTAWLLGVAAYTAALTARGRSDLPLMLRSSLGHDTRRLEPQTALADANARQ